MTNKTSLLSDKLLLFPISLWHHNLVLQVDASKDPRVLPPRSVSLLNSSGSISLPACPSCRSQRLRYRPVQLRGAGSFFQLAPLQGEFSFNLGHGKSWSPISPALACEAERGKLASKPSTPSSLPNTHMLWWNWYLEKSI